MKKTLMALVSSLAGVTPALAHLDPVAHGSIAAGFSHPLFGPDHILAMVVVGLWAALLGGRALWLVPLAFVGMMMLGFAMATGGMKLPFVEPAVAASVVALGLVVLVALQASTGLAATLVGFFALFHGAAHGGELGEANALPFLTGFCLATILLHGLGVGIGLAALRLGGRWVTRLAGGLAALGGLWMLSGA